MAQPAPDPRFPHDHSSPLVTAQNLSVRYDDLEALVGASFHLCAREFVAVIGPNGAGKSTLLKAMLGLVPYDGQVTFSPRLEPHPTRRVAYVPQSRALDWSFPVTVWDTVMMARTRRIGWFRSAGGVDREIVTDALERVGLMDLRSRHIGALSGGQRQRALLARMLARGADILFLDEPFNGVDAPTQTRILEVLEGERSAGKGILLVTHDIEAARSWCSHMLLVNRTVIASGNPARVLTPENITRTFSNWSAT